MSEATAAVIEPRRGQFSDPDWTAKGERRASVKLRELRTLWVNTGSLCNIACLNCYIESSPANDRLAYITAAEVRGFYEEIAGAGLAVREIGFTGGEPFMNPEIVPMVEEALGRGFSALILTNAMQPMLRPRIRAGLLALRDNHRDQLTIRVSLDHYTKELHDRERGVGTFETTVAGLDWLAWVGFRIAIAGRTCWGEAETDARRGYAKLIETRGWPLDAYDPAQLVLFPEMDLAAEVPEITEGCWDILHKQPTEVMCASSRMVVKRKGDARPVVLPCTLLPYDRAFEMGATLTAAAEAQGGMFEQGAVKLCHPHCAKFCVLGGGSCSA